MSLTHPTSIISESAKIGKDVTIGPFCTIGPNVTIGNGCRLISHVTIEGDTTIGENNTFFQFTSIGFQPQDLKYSNEPSKVLIGDNNTFRECVTVHRGTQSGLMLTKIGNNNLLMANCHVAHDCRIGDNNVFANSVALAGHVEIGNRCILGGLSAVHQFSRIGDFAMLSGGTMASKDIPPYCYAQGNHARLRGLNLVGLKRGGFSNEDISAIKSAYMLLFRNPGIFQEKISIIEDKYSELEKIGFFINFLKTSKRGITRAGSEETE